MLRYDGRRHTCACGWAKIQRFPSLKYSQKCRVRMRRRCFHARTLRTVLLCVSALQLSLAVGLSTNVHAATPKCLSTNTSIHQNVECTSKSAADLLSSLPVCVRSCILRSEIQEIRDYNGSNFCSNKDLFISQWGHKTTIFDGCIEMHPSAATPLVACPTERDHASLITAVNTPNRRATTRVQIAPHYPLHSPHITLGLLVSSKTNLVLNLIL